jgi:hypothetical protein
MGFYDGDSGIPFLVVGTTLTAFVVLAWATRIYTRLLLTRSIGSDDFAITLSVAFCIFGAVGGGIQVENGLGKHKDQISTHAFDREELWYVSADSTFTGAAKLG